MISEEDKEKISLLWPKIKEMLENNGLRVATEYGESDISKVGAVAVATVKLIRRCEIDLGVSDTAPTKKRVVPRLSNERDPYPNS